MYFSSYKAWKLQYRRITKMYHADRPSLDRLKTSPVAFKITKFKSARFFFWGYTKNIVYENTSTTRLNIMNRTKRVCEEITPEILTSILEDFKSRLRLCLRNNGGHLNIWFEDLNKATVFFQKNPSIFVVIGWPTHVRAYTRTQKRCKSNQATSTWYAILGMLMPAVL